MFPQNRCPETGRSPGSSEATKLVYRPKSPDLKDQWDRNGPEGMTVVADGTTRAQLFVLNPFNVLKAQVSDYVWMRVVMVVVSHLISQNGQASCV